MIGYFLPLPTEDLDTLKADPSQVETYIMDKTASEDAIFDIDKSWQAIDAILKHMCPDADNPASQAVLGGTEIGDEDVGYGRARYLEATEVAAIAAALSSIQLDNQRDFFVSDIMGNPDIYPIFENIDDFDYIDYCFIGLRNFYESCAAENKATLLFIE